MRKHYLVPGRKQKSSKISKKKRQTSCFAVYILICDLSSLHNIMTTQKQKLDALHKTIEVEAEEVETIEDEEND